MEIVDLASQDQSLADAAARLLVDEFDPAYGWPTLDAARATVRDAMRDGVALAMIDGDALLGWIGGFPEYDGNVWELHPRGGARGHRRRGIGRRLVEALEAEAAQRGAITIMLGTDDTAGMTSLSGVDLYDDLPARLGDLHDLGRAHPFLFYRKLGYVVTGVVPDANGAGKPDILMCKRVAPAATTLLFRPIGPAERELLEAAGWRRWPPRLPGQPIFYPVTNFEYALEIASKWNVASSGAGYVTRFRVRTSFMQRFDVHQVGAARHTEWWIPAEMLDELNANIVGTIEIVASFP